MKKDDQLEMPLSPRRRVVLADDDLPAERTQWRCDDPPMQGFWEVHDVFTNEELGRWWWDGAHWKRPQDTDKHARMTVVPGELFSTQYAWRGLTQPSPDIYPCPPYDSSILGPLALAAGVSLRTLHVIINQKRMRVRL